MADLVKSQRFKLNMDDVKRVARNAAIFFAPMLLMVLVALQQDASLQEVYWIIRLWMLNTAIDLVRKFVATNK